MKMVAPLNAETPKERPANAMERASPYDTEEPPRQTIGSLLKSQTIKKSMESGALEAIVEFFINQGISFHLRDKTDTKSIERGLRMLHNPLIDD